jgi:hypothetical protein
MLIRVTFLLLLTFSAGCDSNLIHPIIGGGSDEMFAIGRVTTLDLGEPDTKVVVVVIYPRPVDETWHPGFGHSGNVDDNKTWEDLYKVRFEGDQKLEILTVKWMYSTRTRKLRIGDVQCDLPIGKVAVVNFDDDMKPTCKVVDNVPKVIEIERQKRIRELRESLPTIPSP